MRPKNLILLTLDCVRPDHLGCYGYRRWRITPHIDRLAERGVVFPDVISQSCFTGYSHASLLTGLYPFEHGYHHNLGGMAEGVPTLPEAFERAGYQTGAFIGVEFLGRNQGFARGFGHFDDDFSDFLWRNEKVWNARIGRDWRDNARSWLRDVCRREEPFFMWGHWFATHQGCSDALPGSLGALWLRLRFPPDKGLPEPYRYYDAQIAHCDRYVIGALLSELREAGQLEHTILAVTSDHGQALGQHGYMGHDNLYSGTVRVPLVMAGPGVRECFSGGPPELARSIDILPLCMRVAGVDGPWPHNDDWGPEGAVSAYSYGVSVDLEDQTNNVYIESLQDHVWKLLRHGDRTELYHIRNDPEEKNDLAAERPQMVEKKRECLTDLRGGFSYRDAHMKRDYAAAGDEKLLENLRNLGYL